MFLSYLKQAFQTQPSFRALQKACLFSPCVFHSIPSLKLPYVLNPFIHPHINLPIYIRTHPYICPSIRALIYPRIHPHTHVPIYPPICFSGHPSTCPSIPPSESSAHPAVLWEPRGRQERWKGHGHSVVEPASPPQVLLK